MRELTLAELRAAVGSEVAASDWFAVTQPIIDEFADATRDPQWIHVDVERAARESPFRDAAGERCTVAHGFLTLSLLSHFADSSFRVEGMQVGVNVGFERVRFVSPVPAGGELRAHFTLARCDDIEAGVQLTWQATVELRGAPRPALTAQWLVWLLAGPRSD